VRVRTHAAVGASAHLAAAIARRDARADAAARPQLRVVPRRRRAAGFAATVSVLVAGVLLATAVLHTRLAERQLEIDRLERGVTAAQERFDVLRRQRAELRSPTRLAEEAARLGMQPAQASEFMAIDPWVLATAIAAAGRVPSADEALAELEPLDQFRLVKSVAVQQAAP
jgi:hypothetical protein